MKDDLWGTGNVYPGESTKGNVVFEIPTANADDTGAFLLDVDGDIYRLPLDGSDVGMPATEAPEPEPSESTSEATETSQGPAGTVVLTADSEGDGPATLDSPYMRLSVPADATYEVSTLNHNASNGRGVIVLYIDKASGGEMTYEISTTRMVESLDDTVAECERMNSFNGSWATERLDDVVFNGVIYATVSLTQDSKQNIFYTTYYAKGDVNHHVEAQVVVKSIVYSLPQDDPMVTHVMESIEYK